jgi:hypothetical protein
MGSHYHAVHLFFRERMLSAMPEVSKTEVGRRLFQVHKGKGVETAIKKIRQGIGDDWNMLTRDDTVVLERMLGECWVYLDRTIWEKISFSGLSYQDIRQIITIGNRSAWKDSTDRKSIEDVTEILKKTF